MDFQAGWAGPLVRRPEFSQLELPARHPCHSGQAVRSAAISEFAGCSQQLSVTPDPHPVLPPESRHLVLVLLGTELTLTPPCCPSGSAAETPAGLTSWSESLFVSLPGPGGCPSLRFLLLSTALRGSPLPELLQAALLCLAFLPALPVMGRSLGPLGLIPTCEGGSTTPQVFPKKKENGGRRGVGRSCSWPLAKKES